jgi:leader peptidase (prepilin peptidase) / N-methyltransferase
MIRILGTTLAALLGLAFGSFLNVCLSRWPEGESVVKPRSHCRNCGRTLAWWENVPLVSWVVLRGRCRTCDEKISWRYPLVELAVGALWACTIWQAFNPYDAMGLPSEKLPIAAIDTVCHLIFFWLLVALAVLDAEHLWLPNWLTWPGIALGLLLVNIERDLNEHALKIGIGYVAGALLSLLQILAAAGLILIIRWTYWLIRRREGIGLGDAKLMAMLGAWLGLSGALLSFAIGVLLGAVFALVVLCVPAARRESEMWLLSKLPLGTFLCVGGIASALWGQPIIAAYLGWVGLR